MKSILLLLLLVTATGCALPDEPNRPAEVPLIPVAQVTEMGGIYGPLRAALQVHDRAYPLVRWTAAGERVYEEHDLDLYPTDVMVVLLENAVEPVVFLARSPHGGCLVQWDAERESFIDPCYGSEFALTGERLEGPAQRGLDRLPAEVRDEMVWVWPEIIEGEPVR